MTIGSEFAEVLYSEIKDRLYSWAKPYLAVVQVGADPASTVYIKFKRRACEKLGFGFEHYNLDGNTTTEQLIKQIDVLNKSEVVTGVIVQLPLPEHIDTDIILNTVDPSKDVDCFHRDNVGRLYLGKDHIRFAPATAYGVYRFLKHHGVETQGKCCVVVGKSNIVGKPMQLLMAEEDDCACTTISCDKHTEDLSKYIRMADIIIVAAGKHHLINNPDDIKEGTVIVDVGINRVEVDGKKVLQGDVDYDRVKHKCSLITPVPGGVGPITVATLMYNLARPYMGD